MGRGAMWLVEKAGREADDGLWVRGCGLHVGGLVGAGWRGGKVREIGVGVCVEVGVWWCRGFEMWR